MKLIFLLLEYQICISSFTIKFLITKPFNIRTYIIFLLFMIYKDNENSYYNNTIIKYFFRLHFLQFEIFTYF